ncbi:MAG: ABC transporter ATP-binding protein [Acidobacteria bacterium]|jgi:putative ABC transport system ATP-binding protein|nr:ABC transporter ATP-binding protein [Acidobacteriota bacterium]
MSICELRDATKTYGSGAAAVHALDKVSLAFEPGEFTAISGPSGSGKTTLLNLVGLLDVPTSGSVSITGQAAGGLGSRALARLRAENIGFVFQSFNLVPVLTATENVEMALHLAGTSGDRRKLAQETLAAVGLGEMLKRKPAELSGGQQQRVAVARALVKKPAVVIADEPTANLDSTTGSQILDLMREMNDQRKATFIFSTHDPMVMARARRVIALHDGQVAGDEVREPAADGSGGA